MAFNKAAREAAKEILKNTPGTKSYKPPKRKKKPKPRGPHTMKRQVRKKMGPLTQGEKIAVEALVVSVTPEETEEQLQQRGRALGIALRRSPGAIRDEVLNAQERLTSRATLYVDLHMKAAAIAAEEGNAAPAQWAIERITAKDEKGKKVRIVEPAKTEDTGSRGPTVNIGVALGGMIPGATLAIGAPRVTATVIDTEPENE